MSQLPIAQDYLAAVEQSGLIEPGQIQAVARACTATEADQLAQEFEKAGLLTNWQNRLLLRGKWQNFFMGRYRLLRPVGSGSMSRVYLGQHEILHRFVALKVLVIREKWKHTQVVRFQRESQALGALNHEHVVRIHDFDRHKGLWYLVLEYVDGPSTRQIVDSNGPLSVEQAADYIQQSAEGLAYLHKRDFVHRDIKPANLLVNSKGSVKIADLGLAQLVSAKGPSLTERDGNIVGTVDYLPPEQAVDSHKIGPPADIYSLGCSLCYLLTGSPPFSKGSTSVRLMHHQHEKPKKLSELRDDVPSEIDAMYQAMMAKKAKKRPPAAEIASFLSSWLKTHPPPDARKPCSEDSSAETIVSSPSTLLQLKAQSQEASQATPPPQEVPPPKPPEPLSQKVLVTCAGCQSQFRAPRTALGRKASCPRCGTSFRLVEE